MKIAITGGTGFLGRHVTDLLVEEGNEIYILTRSPDKYEETSAVHYVGWLKEGMEPERELPPLDAIINLAGESLFGYWTEKKKKKIRESRIQATEQIIELIRKMEKTPKVLINASAMGYYGPSGSQIFTEKTETPGDDFVADVTVEWERTALKAEELGVRTIFARFGLLLGEEGALPLMSLPFKLFAGGRIGSGEQYVSWIHVDDAARMLSFAISSKMISGPMNVTAPAPKRNKDFSKILAQVLKRPYWVTVPAPLMKKTLGKMSSLILEGQYIYPAKAEDAGFTFDYPELKPALKEIFQK